MGEAGGKAIILPGEGRSIDLGGFHMSIKARGDETGDAFSLLGADEPPGFGTPLYIHDVIAVEPARQGKRIGGSLLRAVSGRADTDELPVVPITFQPGNLALYQRHGYAVVCEETAPVSGPSWWRLRRNPGA